ncbi:MAG: hypothetical protein R3C01_13450, partial [Planctomycetaceae bacterium]
MVRGIPLAMGVSGLFQVIAIQLCPLFVPIEPFERQLRLVGVHSPDCDPRRLVIFAVSLSLSPAIDVPISKDSAAGETEWKDRRSLGAWV